MKNFAGKTAFSTVVTLMSCLLLAGCASSQTAATTTAPPGGSALASASPSPTASPTASPSPQAAASRLVIGQHGLTVITASDEQLPRMDYTSDADAARATLTALIGTEPTATPHEASDCNRPFVRYEWAGISLDTEGNYFIRDPSLKFYISIKAPATANGLILSSFDGTTVGQSAAPLYASDEVTVDDSDIIPDFMYFEPGSSPGGGRPYPHGVYVSVGPDGNVTNFGAPDSKGAAFC